MQRVSIVDVLDESFLGDSSDEWNGIRGSVRFLGLMLLYNGFGLLSV